ncbi:flagellar basal-body MS-ring/collar protein FliF [Desulfurobacterium thermolithotrophum]|uniref:flagellar basal-body MS-ring/collar protein FliF n=1 Tax=Desulfurobacterium thermolithotrophum TaxID=64160 RepID=UPI0013D3CB3C|nr:flagellar basal-body MS-ring/collar protein FliF [Desulfurobacterium thermolithotrophum]
MNIKEIQTKIQEIFKKNANPKNVILLLSALTLVSFLAFIAIKQSSTEDYAVLYTHLSPDDAGSILSVLQEEHIPYKIEGNGSIILVPKEKVYDVRLKLAAKGLPHGKVVGFELFDEPKLGITQFQENVEFLRALEGELERTIKRINAIQDVKVNIALPKDSIFVRESEEPKASILVNLWPGRELTKEQVKAIVFLVSHAVPGLKPENVTVIDNRGRVLTDLLSENEDETGSSKELEVKRKLEKEIERKIQSMLSQVLGSGKVVVRASVEIETGRLEKKEELYDPDMTAVVSERKIQEKETGIKPKEQGVPGTTTNVPPVLNLNQGNEILKKEKKDVTTNYDVSKTIQKTVTPIFKIKRISVGVLVDGKYQKEKDKAGNEIIKFVPRSQEEIKTYEEIVKSAIGYDPKRGDTVTVASVPFEAKQLVQKEKTQKKFPWIYIAAGGGLLALILIGIIALKLLKSKKAEPQQPEIPETLMAEMKARAEHKEELEELHIESDPLYIKIVEIAKEHPELVANVISKWIREEGISK